MDNIPAYMIIVNLSSTFLFSPKNEVVELKPYPASKGHVPVVVNPAYSQWSSSHPVAGPGQARESRPLEAVNPLPCDSEDEEYITMGPAQEHTYDTLPCNILQSNP